MSSSATTSSIARHSFTPQLAQGPQPQTRGQRMATSALKILNDALMERLRQREEEIIILKKQLNPTELETDPVADQ
jgi:hypothetical protein